MTDLHLPWLEICMLVPLLGAAWVSRLRDAETARNVCLVFTCLTFCLTLGTWIDFRILGEHDSDDAWHLMRAVFGHEIFVIDKISAPLLPITALLFALTTLATVHTKAQRFSFAMTLVAESILLATFSSKDPGVVVALLTLGTIPPLLELRSRNQSTGVYTFHMGLSIICMVVGWFCVRAEHPDGAHSLYSILPLLIAVLIRSGIAPFHCWVTDLYHRAAFGTALLYTVPLAGAYAAVRLILPVAPDWVLRGMGMLSLFTAVYAGGMALVQKEGRRFFCYLFLSHSAFILAGLEMVSEIGLTGALCMWISVGLSMGGLGLMLRAIEARRGRLMLTEFHGLYDHMPMIAICFLLTGLAAVGFPGTLGFIGAEMLVDGAVVTYPYVGAIIVFAAALNGIAVVQTYYLLFTGKKHLSSVSLGISMNESFAVLILMTLLILGGTVPQFNVTPRHAAAVELLNYRHEHFLDRDPASVPVHPTEP
jgi:NADH-quinone oxidoreductase subunit M